MKKRKLKKSRRISAARKIFIALIAVMLVSAYGLMPITHMTDNAFAEDWYTMDDSGKVVIKEGTEKVDTTFQYDWEGEVTSVIIPASVKNIDENAFFGCSSLTSVVFEGETPPSIGDGAFETGGDSVAVTVPAGTSDSYADALQYAFYSTDYEIIEAGDGAEEPGSESVAFVTEDVEGGVEITALGDGFKVPEGDDVTITVPDKIDGKQVIGIADGQRGTYGEAINGVFWNKLTGTSGKRITVELPDSIEYIGDFAFYNCPRLVSVNTPENLKRVGENAFYNCQSLENFEFIEGLELASGAFKNCYAFSGVDGVVNLPAGVTAEFLEGDKTEATFSMCSSIEKFVIDESNENFMSDEDGVVFSKDGTQLVQYPLGRTASSYDIPEGVTVIKKNAFKWNANDSRSNSLENVTFPNSLKTVEDNAFMCSGLTSVSMPANIEWGTGVFQLNKKLKTININEGVKDIPDNFFYGLDNVEEINLPDTLETIGYRAFDRCGVTEIRLPDGLRSIGEEAFEASSLKSVEIPASVTEIGDRAFYMCKNLSDINIKGGNKALDLGRYTFNACDSLTDIYVPDRVTKLDDGVFSNCQRLRTVDMANVTELGNGVFAYSGLEEMELPDTIKTMGNATFFECSSLKSAALPAYLENLGTCTFEVCWNLTDVVIPDTVKFKTVPEDTFWNCGNLTELTLPESVKATEACAFSGCSELKDVNIKNTKDNFVRSEFDCYSIKLDGDYSKYGYWVEGVFYLYEDVNLEEVINGQDPSKDTTDELNKLDGADENYGSSVSNAAFATEKTVSSGALCGCSVGGGGSYSATANPSFNYIVPGSNAAAGSGSAAYSKSSAAGTGYGTAATGDDAYIMIFILLAMLSATYMLAYKNKAR